MYRPPLDVLLYALSRPDPRERFVALIGVRMAFPARRRDPEWQSGSKNCPGQVIPLLGFPGSVVISFIAAFARAASPSPFLPPR